MAAEIIFDPDSPLREAWEEKYEDRLSSEAVWSRLSVIVLHDLVQYSGVYDALGKRSRDRLDRRVELALDPTLPPTPKEQRRANEGYCDTIPLHLLPVVAAGAGILSVVERYSKSALPGHGAVAARLDEFGRRLDLANAVDDEVDEVEYALLDPQLRTGQRTLRRSDEPSTYIIPTDDLLEAYEATAALDGTHAEYEKFRVMKSVSELAPRPMTLADQRARAMQTFMASQLFHNGDVQLVMLERHARFLPNGPHTFRIEVTHPYKQLYEDEPNMWVNYMDGGDYPGRFIANNPLHELVEASRV